jgi:DNA polymerase III delta prime subunit
MTYASNNAVQVRQPTCLNDFALLPTSRHKLESLLDGTLSFPDHGVCGIIFYGLYGTGKTTIARLLPGLLETAKADPSASALLPGEITRTVLTHASFEACMQGQNGVSLIYRIERMTSLISINPSGLQYVILDEVDLLTDAAKASFKALMNFDHTVFLMTTNNLNDIDMGVQNRSLLIDMNVPPATDWRPLLRRVYTDSGLTAPADAVLDQVVLAGRGSARSIFSDVVMSANQARRDGRGGVDQINNIRS